MIVSTLAVKTPVSGTITKAKTLLDILGIDELAQILAAVADRNAAKIFSTWAKARASCKQMSLAVRVAAPSWGGFLGVLVDDWVHYLPGPNVKIRLIIQKLNCICTIAPELRDGQEAEFARLLGPVMMACLSAEVSPHETVTTLNAICNIAPGLRKGHEAEFASLLRPMMDACLISKRTPFETVCILDQICDIAPGVKEGHEAVFASLLKPMLDACLKKSPLDAVVVLENICDLAPGVKQGHEAEFARLLDPMVYGCLDAECGPLEVMEIFERMCAMAPSLVHVSYNSWDWLFISMLRILMRNDNLPEALDFIRRFCGMQPVVLRNNVSLMNMMMIKFGHLMIHTLHDQFNFDLNSGSALNNHTVLMEAVRYGRLSVLEELVLGVFAENGLYHIDVTVVCNDGHDVFYYLREVKDEHFKMQAEELLNLLLPERLLDRRDAQYAKKKANGQNPSKRKRK